MTSSHGASTPSRADSARATRLRILDAARRLFTAHGYVSTTMRAIASEAGVAVQTMYFTFGNKRTVLKELVDVSVAGDDEPIPTLERLWFAQVLAETDPSRLIRRYVHQAGLIYERLSDVLEVVRTAAVVDAEIAELWRTNQQQRLTVQRRVVEALCALGSLTPSLTVATAADTVFVILGPETFRLLIVDRGWSVSAWDKWAGALLCGQLLAVQKASTDR